MTYEPRHRRILTILRQRTRPCQVIISADLSRDDHAELLHRARTLAFTYDAKAKVNGWRM